MRAFLVTLFPFFMYTKTMQNHSFSTDLIPSFREESEELVKFQVKKVTCNFTAPSP